MALVVHRSARVELLADALDRVVRRRFEAMAQAGAADPFAAVQIIVGSRGMERWLRHRLASGPSRIAARLQFPFPRSALEAATDTVLGADGAATSTVADRARWSKDTAAAQLITRIRGLADDPRFAAAANYIGAGLDDWAAPERPVRARELLFVGEVSAVLDRLLHDRPEDALRWMADPASAPAEHQWLAALLRAWAEDAAPTPSPAERFAALLAAEPRPQPTALHLFGLSTLGRHEIARIGALARSFDVHLYALAPSSVWWEHVRTRGEAKRALQQATTSEAALEVQAEFERQNALLSSLGRPSRDLQAWLEAVGYLEADVHSEGAATNDSGRANAADATSASTLHELQAWLDQAGDRDQLGPLRPDASLELHAAHGPLRQVEALRDRLLALLDADPTLTPRDILVMTPDLETFAPLCAAIFARRGVGNDGKRLPALPAHVADLGLRSTNPLAALLLQLLALCDERLTAASVCDLAAHEPVRRRFAIDGVDLAGMRALAQQSGMRWGLDADDRAAAGQPAAYEHTLRFGLDRLALGALWPDDDGPLDVVDAAGAEADRDSADPSLPSAVRPMPLASADQRRRFGQLAQLVDAVETHRRGLRAARSAQRWRSDLLAAVDALGEVSDRAHWLRVELDETLSELLPDDDASGERPAMPPLEAEAVRRLLQGAFETSAKGDRPITGAITVCALEPMRSVPFRVIALLGMDDGKFPRSSRAPTWSPFATPQPGERDRREVDRHLLLEAIVSARDHLLVLWSGFNLQTGDKQPAAVPIEELIDLLVDRGAAEPDARSREAWTQSWPLQPWSPGRFAPTAPPVYDADLAAAAQDLVRHRRDGHNAAPLGSAARELAQTGALQPLPPRERGDADLDARALGRDLITPAATLLARRLRVQGDRGEASLQEREAFDLDTLTRWGLVDRAIDAALVEPAADEADEADADQADADQADADAPSLAARLERAERATGSLPHGVVGTAEVAAAVATAELVVARLSANQRAAANQPHLPLRCTIDGVALRAQPRIRDDQTLIWLTASKTANARLRLEACYGTLIARVALAEAGLGDETPVLGVCIGSAAKDEHAITSFAAPSAATARAWLQQALALRERALNEALPMFSGVSWALATAEHVAEGKPLTAKQRGQLRAKIQQEWAGGFGGRPGDGDDPAVQQLWRGWTPLDVVDDGDPLGMTALAGELWAPALQMMEAAGSAIDAAIKPADEGDR